MSSTQLSPRFVIFVVVSLITHLLELAASGLFCHLLIQQGDLKTPWFSLSAGLLIIPLVVVQLASAVFLLKRKGETSSSCEVTATAVLHVLQLGFISRHFAILQEAPLPSKKAEVVEMLLLRLSFAFTSGCTLFLMQVFLLFRDAHESSWLWAVYVSGVTTLVSITWAVSTFRRCVPDLDFDRLLITWPGTILRILWRSGEILTRLIALGLFASVYTHWLFLVLGLHWMAMLVCVCIPVMTSLDWRTTGCTRRTVFCIMTSFAYIFAFINTSADNAVFRYTFYYVVLFLENSTLIAVWLIQSSSDDFDRNSTFVYIAAIAFVISIISMIIYYKFFHVAAVKSSPTTTCASPTCVTCKLGESANHPPIPPRPGPAGSWLSQYQSAVTCGQYYKHNLQDSLLDSVSERNSTVTVSSSHARLQHKLATIDDGLRECENTLCKQAKQDGNSSSASNPQEKVSSKSRKKDKRSRKGATTTSESELSSARTDAEHSEDSSSQKRPVWLPSGDSNFANQLLSYSLETFDTADTADDERSSVATGCHRHTHSCTTTPRDQTSTTKLGGKPAPFPGSTYQRNGEHHWYSDGYSTDRTLEWPKIPLTSLQRNMWSDTADTESECTHCCECSHGDSEVSSIMRSVTAVPTVDGKFTHCHHPDHQHKHHHHHQHHHHPHHSKSHHHHTTSPRSDDSSRVPKKHRHDELSPRDLDAAHGHKSKSHMVGRNEVLSSPASDPSYGPKSKRKSSPRRKVHTSTHQEKSTSHSKSKEHQSISKNLPQSQLCSDMDHVSHSLAHNDRLADELLKSGGHGEPLTPKDRLNSASTLTSDPRFNVRVMTSADETTNCTSDASSSGKTSKKNRSRSKAAEADPEGKDREQKTRRSKTPADSNHSSTPVDTYVITSSSTNTQHQGRSSEPSGSDREVSGKNSDNQDCVTVSNKIDQPEVIYENIWQVNQLKHSKHNKSAEIKDFNSDTGSSRTGSRRISSATRDAWYVCSESEDSALPPEALSSSVDGFTASDNDSDVSMEIVI